MAFVIVSRKYQCQKNLGTAMPVLKRYKLFLVSAFVVAGFSLILLLRYSTISKINVNLSGSAELGLKYLNDLKEKLSQKTESSNSKNKYITSVGQKETEKRITTDNIDHLVESSLKKNSEKNQDVAIELATENTKPLLQSSTTTTTTTTTETTAVTQPKNEPAVVELTTQTVTKAEKVPLEKGKEGETNSESTNDGLELCPAKPPDLVGPLYVDQQIPRMEDLNKYLSSHYGGWVLTGGAWAPTECKARTKTALIVPYRNRYEQLGILLRHMHPMLKRQNIDYRIIIVEQSGTTPFNRAMLFNIGYKEALKFQEFDCFIFHDVDLIPEDDRNLYSCPTSPRHLSVAIDKFNYVLPYTTIFGGAGSFKREHFEAINGFSNRFWGWGGEDDDLYNRIAAKGFKLTRPAVKLARYKMIKAYHKSSAADPERVAKLRNSAERMKEDGLNSLVYKVLKIDEEPIYTMITVEVDRKLV